MIYFSIKILQYKLGAHIKQIENNWLTILKEQSQQGILMEWKHF